MKATTTKTDLTLAQWLESEKCKAFDVQPVMIEIDGETFEGCFYRQEYEYKEGMACVQDKRHFAGEKYTEAKIYCLGRLPLCKHPKRKKYPLDNVCFPYRGIDWYVAAYMPLDRLSPPFGENFILAPWNLADPIDKWESKPYVRFPLTVSPDVSI